jgi:hypothetical protein
MVSTWRAWFEQQLVEAVMGAQGLRDARQWTFEDVQRLWSEEASQLLCFRATTSTSP